TPRVAEMQRMPAASERRSQCTYDLLVQVAARLERMRAIPHGTAVWHCVDLSEAYGTLGERAFMLRLAEALFEAGQKLDELLLQTASLVSVSAIAASEPRPKRGVAASASHHRS